MQPFKGPIVSNIEKIEEVDGHEIVTSKAGIQYLICRDVNVDFLIDMVLVIQQSKNNKPNFELRFPLARDLERDLYEREPIPRHLLEWAIYCFEYEED
jgi:hypothetical protein